MGGIATYGCERQGVNARVSNARARTWEPKGQYMCAIYGTGSRASSASARMGHYGPPEPSPLA